MLTIYRWILDNWQLIIVMGVLLIILAMTGNITKSARAAKKGLKEAVTPLGFFIFLGIVYISYLIYLSILETL